MVDPGKLLEALQDYRRTVTPQQYFDDMAKANPGRPRLEDVLRKLSKKRRKEKSSISTA